MADRRPMTPVHEIVHSGIHGTTWDRAGSLQKTTSSACRLIASLLRCFETGVETHVNSGRLGDRRADRHLRIR